MKLLSILFFLFAATTMSHAQQTNFKTAIDFNDYIVGLQDSIGYGILAFNKIIENNTLSKSEMNSQALAQLEKIKKTTRSVTAALGKATPYKGGDALKTAALNLFNFYYKTMDVEYKQMVVLLGAETYTDAIIKELTEIQERIVNSEKGYDFEFGDAQKKFADLYHFSLDENQLEKEINK